MIYLKLFDTESNYLAYRYDKENYLKPNISFCERKDTVYYNYPPVNPNFNGHDYVDLGLPSGTLWATMNVGASKPSDYGLYFQWGDTQGYTADQIGTGDGKKEFARNWSDYKWYSGSTFTKYTIPGAVLELEDDAAHVHMGGDWHMPTPEQIQELLDKTTNEWTILNSVNGRRFTSKNGKSIFFPAAGCAWDGSVNDVRRGGYAWSSMLSEGNVKYGQYLNFGSGDVGLSGYSRFRGRAVRGVLG